MRTIKKRIARFLVWFFNINHIDKGRKIWQCVDKELPKAVGATYNDKPRISLFAIKIQRLNFLDYYFLQCFLEKELYELEHNYCCFTTGVLEEYEARTKQIYSQHLEIMKSPVY